MFSCCRRSKATSTVEDDVSPVYYEKIYNVTRKKWATHIRGQRDLQVTCEDNLWDMNDIIVGFYTIKGDLYYEALHVPDRYVMYMMHTNDYTDEYPPIIIIDRESRETIDVDMDEMSMCSEEESDSDEESEESEESESDEGSEESEESEESGEEEDNQHILQFLERCIEYEMAGTRNFYKVATYRCAMKYVRSLEYHVNDPEKVRSWPDTPGWNEKFSHGTCNKIAEFLEGFSVEDICTKK